ncbi:GtrA family protein [Nocardioides sp.]|uniref:GtrA family protein n=1 Tax=Nocardioides sp. TaxID=35761 RepID=UPI003518C207
MSRHRRLAAEVLRFFVVAQAATWVSFVLFNMLVHGLFLDRPPMPDQAILGYVVANSVGMVISYHGASRFVFPHRPPVQADGGWSAYIAINLAAMVLPLGCLAISRHVLGLDSALADNVAGNGIGLVLAFVARFYLFRRFVFRRPALPQAATESVAG